MRNDIINHIFGVAKERDAFDKLEKNLADLSKKQLGENLIQCGVLPEMFDHDSSEEKIWAKYSDILLAKVLNHLGIQSEVLGARGNSADVFGKTLNYTIVGDAKTFRLSRSAKNQKDFKVSSLDSWRKENNFAMLSAPLMQYPKNKSQIYAQAIDKNVTLISYTHLLFLLEHYTNQSLQPIWEVGTSLSKTEKREHNKANFYWHGIDEIVTSVVGKTINDINTYKQYEIEITNSLAQEGISFWKEKIDSFYKLSKDDAIKLLIKSSKIEAKIKMIQKFINTK